MREAGREQIVRGPNRGPGEPRPSSPRRAFGHGTPRRGDQPRLKSPVKPSWARLDHGEGVLRDGAAAWAATRLWPRGRRLGQQLPLREDGTRGLGSAEVVLLTLHTRFRRGRAFRLEPDSVHQDCVSVHKMNACAAYQRWTQASRSQVKRSENGHSIELAHVLVRDK